MLRLVSSKNIRWVKLGIFSKYAKVKAIWDIIQAEKQSQESGFYGEDRRKQKVKMTCISSLKNKYLDIEQKDVLQ